ncbi:MAG: hypothetical protein COB14_07500 [Alphaproteobacteria bacterium]|nr:MAG: hypothetical protein COB14_07500 [Alphaproteobacteria bacterium]
MSNELTNILTDEQDKEIHLMGLVVNECLINEGLDEDRASTVVAQALKITKGVLRGEVEPIIID